MFKKLFTLAAAAAVLTSAVGCGRHSCNSCSSSSSSFAPPPACCASGGAPVSSSFLPPATH